jgi:hypothetical protein
VSPRHRTNRAAAFTLYPGKGVARCRPLAGVASDARVLVVLVGAAERG